MAENEVRVLIRLSGPDIDDQQLQVGRQGLRIGRTKDNNLALESREISRQHVRIVWRDDKYFVEDLNSSNGTWLNDARMTAREPRELRPEDVIRMGPFLMRVLRFIVVADEPALALVESVPLESSVAVQVKAPRAQVHGILSNSSTWMKYLPAVFDNDDFVGRYLLIMESVFSPITWMLDNFDFYLDVDTMPAEWLQWVGSWFDILILAELPIERQRVICQQLGWLFSRRGTKAALQRLLELYFESSPEILEPDDEPCHFVVKLSITSSPFKNPRDLAERIILSQKPAFASFTLEFSQQ